MHIIGLEQESNARLCKIVSFYSTYQQQNQLQQSIQFLITKSYHNQILQFYWVRIAKETEMGTLISLKQVSMSHSRRCLIVLLVTKQFSGPCDQKYSFKWFRQFVLFFIFRTNNCFSFLKKITQDCLSRFKIPNLVEVLNSVLEKKSQVLFVKLMLFHLDLFLKIIAILSHILKQIRLSSK